MNIYLYYNLMIKADVYKRVFCSNHYFVRGHVKGNKVMYTFIISISSVVYNTCFATHSHCSRLLIIKLKVFFFIIKKILKLTALFCSIRRLQGVCHKWGLQINLQESKIVKFIQPLLKNKYVSGWINFIIFVLCRLIFKPHFLHFPWRRRTEQKNTNINILQEKRKVVKAVLYKKYTILA